MSGNKQLEQLLAVLGVPPASRSDADVDACHAYFRNTKFFRAVGRESEKARDCCKHLVLDTFEENDPIFMQGDFGDRFFFVLDGSVRMVKSGSVVGELGPGSSFGELAVLGRTEREQKRIATVIAEEHTKLASLHRAQYLQAVGSFDMVIQKALKIPPMQRTSLDTDMLLAQFDQTDFFQRLCFVALQKKCCSCMTPVVFKRNQQLELRKGQKYLCIVVSGGLSLSQGGKTVRSLGENDSFMGDTVSEEGGVLTGTKDGALAVLSKQNYDEVTSNSFAQIRQVLSKPPQKRTRKELDFSLEMFCHSYKALPFFQALPSAVLRKNSCKMLGCREFVRGATIFREGDDADCLYIIIHGTVELSGELTGGKDLQLSGGSEFGHFDGMGGISEDKVAVSKILSHRTSSAKVISDTCLLATLEKPDFSRLCQLDEIHIWVERFWKLMTTNEPSNDTELRGFFDELDQDGSGDLDRFEIYQLLDGLGRKPSELQLDNLMGMMDPDCSGEVDFDEFSAWWWAENAEARTSMAPAERPDLKATFQSVDTDNSGVVDYDELLIGLKKMDVVKTKEDEAAVHTLLAEFDKDNSGALDFDEFCGLCRKLQSGQSTLAMLDSKKAPSGIRYIKFEHYELLHSRVAKSVAPDFTEAEAEKSGREDWKEDLQRFGNKNDELDRQQFGHAMFQLVDEWCGGASSTQMIVGWLRMLFANIVDMYGRFKALKDIGCIDDALTNMCEGQRQNDERDKKEAEKRFQEHAAELKKQEKAEGTAQAKAEKAERAKKEKEKKAQAKKAQKAKKEKAAKAKADRARQKEKDKAAKASKQAGGGAGAGAGAGAGVASSPTQLDRAKREQEELHAAAAVAAVAAAAAERDRKLAALDDEEAELMRRLESGELTPAEEAEVRARLAAIASEREAVHAAYAVAAAGAAGVVVGPGGRPMSPVDKARLDSQLKEFDAKLSALDDEEAELLRRLEAGELSPEEEAEVRARLKAIAAERKQIEHERHEVLVSAGQAEQAQTDRRSDELAAELAAVDRKLSALDDEEAELMRRLESGELTEEEARAVRERLAAIATERESLLEQRQAVTKKQAEHAKKSREHQRKSQAAARRRALIDSKLSALDDEEAELKRRLASGKLTPAEAAAARARLEAIATERKALQLEAEVAEAQQGLAMEIAHLDGKLAALDDEEAELMRRLESGELTPAEEAEVRARLAAIASEREAIMESRQLLVHKQEEKGFLARQARLEAEVIRLKNQLGALDDEEADLLRRLAMGDLSPDEEAEIRARLAAIEGERATLQRKLEKKTQLMRDNDLVAAAHGGKSPAFKKRMSKLRGAVHLADFVGKFGYSTSSARGKADSQGDITSPSDSPNADGLDGKLPWAETDEQRAKRERTLRRDRDRRRGAILADARASAAAHMNLGGVGSTLQFDTRRKTRAVKSTQGGGGRSADKWHRWKETAERLDGGWSTAVVTEYDRQNRRPTTAQRQLQYQDELRQSRPRLKSQLFGRPEPDRTRHLMDAARIERRRTHTEYIAAKIATETKARQAKGFVLPTFGPGALGISSADSPLAQQQHRARYPKNGGAARATTPTNFMQERRRPDSSPEQSPRAGVHPYDQYVHAMNLANPNQNQGRSSKASHGHDQGQGQGRPSSRPKSVAW